tara:strand:- start:749 stop:1612 length:864 start_codon:yes stop_codon:yes gene_type:complete
MKNLILLSLLALTFSFTCYSKNYEENIITNAINFGSTPDIISENESLTSAPILTTYTLFIKLYNGNIEAAETKFYFQDGLTLGLDPGYDAGAFDQDTALSSRLVEDNQGTNFAINAMGLVSAYNQSVPLIINQSMGQTFRIDISQNTLPENVNVYIEDILENTFTPIIGKDFELTTESDLNEEGRFQIHFTTEILGDVLNTNNVFSPDTVTIYKANNNDFITISGIAASLDTTTATLYNMLGKSVHTKTLNTATQTQSISTQGLARGVYVVKLKAGNAMFSKKVLVQ